MVEAVAMYSLLTRGCAHGDWAGTCSAVRQWRRLEGPVGVVIRRGVGADTGPALENHGNQVDGDEMDRIRRWIGEDRPFLGVCFEAHMHAMAAPDHSALE